MVDATDSFWVAGGSRLLRRWTRAKTVCCSTKAAAWYFFLFFEEHPGRGIPDIGSDHDIIHDAETAAARSTPGGTQPPSYSGSLVGSGYSEIGSSVSAQETQRVASNV